jgi:hypothetical protein
MPVGVAVAFLGLAVALQAVARRIEQFGHQGAAHLMALLLQRLGQSAHALAGPPQRRSQIPARQACPGAGRGFDQRLEIGARARVLDNPGLASRPGSPYPPTPMVRPGPIPSDLAQSCSASCRLPSPPRQSPHNPQQTPQPTDGPVRRETALPWTTAPEWAQHRSPPQHMVSRLGCRPIPCSLKSRFAYFLTHP